MAVNSGILKIENKAITSITSHERCIIEDGCQLSEMIEKNGSNVCKNNIHNFIELFVIEIFEWFGKEIKENLSQNLAKTIYQNYYWLKIAELKLFVEKIKAGNWKQIHGMSPAVLMERLNDFCLESMNIRENKANEIQKLSPNFLNENGAIIANLLEVTFKKLNKKSRDYEGKFIDNSEKEKNEFAIKWLKENNIEEKLAMEWFSLFMKRKKLKKKESNEQL